MSKTLSALLLASTFAIAGCGNDQPEPPRENFGGGLGRSYNDMIDQAKQGVEQANQHMQDVEQRTRPGD